MASELAPGGRNMKVSHLDAPFLVEVMAGRKVYFDQPAILAPVCVVQTPKYSRPLTIAHLKVSTTV